MAIVFLLFLTLNNPPKFVVTLDWERISVSLAQPPLLVVSFRCKMPGDGGLGPGTQNRGVTASVPDSRLVPLLDIRECSKWPARPPH